MLFIFDVYATTHGVLTVGGIIAFLIGSLMLFNRADPLFRLSLNYIIPATLVTAAFFIFVIGKGLRAQRLPVKVGDGNADWKNSDRIDSNRFAQRPDFRRRRILERRQRYAYRKRRTG